MRAVKPIQDEYMAGEISGMKSKKKEKKRYPMVRIPLDVIPEAKKWDVVGEGEKGGPYYEIKLKVRMIGLSDARFDKSTEFELRGIETSEAEDESEDDED